MNIAIIGVGNILFCDDGIGVAVVKVLEQCYKFSPSIDIIDGGTLGIGLINYFSIYDNIIILDTISLDDEVGSIYSFPSNELLDLNGYKNTAHEVEVVDMLRSSMMLEKCAKVEIVAIVPFDINRVSIGLSDELGIYFEPYLKTVLNKIESMNIKINKIKEYNITNILQELTSLN